VCGSIGYTASPDQVNCSECGGKHIIIKEAGTNITKSNKEETKDEGAYHIAGRKFISFINEIAVSGTY
jgi:Na+(H+)/acetate symporter ActP